MEHSVKIEKVVYWDNTLTKFREIPIIAKLDQNKLLVKTQDMIEASLATFKELRYIIVVTSDHIRHNLNVTSIVGNKDGVVITTSNSKENS